MIPPTRSASPVELVADDEFEPDGSRKIKRSATGE